MFNHPAKLLLLHVRVLFYILQNFRDLHAEALQVVANCLCECESVHKDGGLTRLMEFLLTPNTPDIQSWAVKCIARVAQSCKIHEDKRQ